MSICFTGVTSHNMYPSPFTVNTLQKHAAHFPPFKTFNETGELTHSVTRFPTDGLNYNEEMQSILEHDTMYCVCLFVCQATSATAADKSWILLIFSNDKHLLSASTDVYTNLVCLHRKVWIGNGIPFPHSGSLSSKLFLFTILTGPACPPVCDHPGRAAAAGSVQVTSELPSRHDWVRPA